MCKNVRPVLGHVCEGKLKRTCFKCSISNNRYVILIVTFGGEYGISEILSVLVATRSYSNEHGNVPSCLYSILCLCAHADESFPDLSAARFTSSALELSHSKSSSSSG